MTAAIELGLALMSLIVWIVLVFLRGSFWRIEEVDRPPDAPADPSVRVVAIVPARNEAETIAASVQSLLAQRFFGRLDVIVVDDESEDGTAAIVEGLAAVAGERLRLVRGGRLAPGWTGKLWALEQGIRAVEAGEASDYFWFTDADIVHGPAVLSGLVGRAREQGAVLVSLMAELNCKSAAERWLVPAFVFFFRKLYPFAWVNDRARHTAAAAGGCVLVERTAFETAGGLEAMAGALIDDCTLGALMKRQGPIHLALTHEVVSIRPYRHLEDIGAMVARSAYAQLGYSPLALAGTVIGMLVIYLVPPVLAIAATGAARPVALLAWALMVLCYVPMLRFYRLNPLRALGLPLVAGLYTLFTIESALQSAMARGGAWKGRFQARPKAGRPG